MLIVIGSVFLWMTLLFGVYLFFRNAAIVDIGWGVSIMLGALLGLRNLVPNTLTYVLVFCILLWGMRLSALLIYRMCSGQRDRRYDALDTHFKKGLAWKYLLFFYFQAVGALIVICPLIAVFPYMPFRMGVSQFFGIAIFAIGFLGNLVADLTVVIFKRQAKNRGVFCAVGLWRFSRHPNYFFELVLWFGIGLFAIPTLPLWPITFIPFVFLLVMILFVTGIPPTEARALEKYGDAYREYQKTTSALIPWKKSKAS